MLIGSLVSLKKLRKWANCFLLEGHMVGPRANLHVFLSYALFKFEKVCNGGRVRWDLRLVWRQYFLVLEEALV